MKVSYKKGDSDSILALSLADDIARCRSKRRQGYRWAGLLSFEKQHIQDVDENAVLPATETDFIEMCYNFSSPSHFLTRRKIMPVPTEAEWGDYEADLDQKHAHKLFAGRTNQEMLPHFRRNVIERTDELRWMPESPFRYYMLGLRDFVMSDDLDELWAADAASCFLGLVVEKLEKQPGYILPIIPQLLPAIRHIAANQATFDASESIYGSFQEKLKRIEALSQTGGQS